ncbi:DMT family transporter [Hydrogenovibrio kuenenii]|uniref:DMT family transporter n=1 Tax=Hydrogenovibrio kuenenii TaxID=63658 RepID=UPI00046542D8|nr:EamA family transporter [Hydrogenovibrio kuenenii]
MSSSQVSFRPAIALLVLGLIWGYNWVVMKGGLPDIAPLWFGAIRTIVPAILLILLLPLLGKPMASPPLKFVVPLGILQTAGFVGFMMWALENGAAGETAVLVFTMPIWLTLMAHLFLHEHLSRLQWWALGVAAVGLFLLIAPWEGHLAMAASIFAVMSGLTWASGSIWQKKYGHLYKLEMINLTAWQMLYGGIAILIAAILFDKWHFNWNANLGWVLFYNLIPAGALGWLLWFYALHNLPTKVAGFGSLLIPTVGVLGAWIQLGERPNEFEALGILFIMAALVMILWPKKINS